MYTDQATDPGKVTGDSRIWDRLDGAGISYRNYGMGAGGPLPQKVFATEPRPAARTDPDYAAQSLGLTDNSRVDAWDKEFDRYVTDGNLPRMEVLRLGNDHTNGTTPGALTPKAMVAENDLAVGRVVDAVSHSPYWKNTAIFITEDDAQNGPDHVDAHRTTAPGDQPVRPDREGGLDAVQHRIDDADHGPARRHRPADPSGRASRGPAV